MSMKGQTGSGQTARGGRDNVKQVGKIQQTNPNNQIAVPIGSRLFFGENLFVDSVHKEA